jgi:hypothetical protein
LLIGTCKAKMKARAETRRNVGEERIRALAARVRSQADPRARAVGTRRAGIVETGLRQR